MNKTQFILGTMIVIIFLLGCLGLYIFRDHASQGNREGTFFIDVEFDKVRKVMVRNNCLEEIVSYQHGEVLDQEWEDLDLSMRRLTKWDIDGVGRLIVKTEDPEAGTLVLPFKQKVAVREDYIDSTTVLMEPVGYLADYRTAVKMSRDGDRTKVELTVSLEYGRKLPANYVEYMDTKVQESADIGWLKAKEAFIAVVNKYKDRRFTLPLRD